MLPLVLLKAAQGHPVVSISVITDLIFASALIKFRTLASSFLAARRIEKWRNI